ncbi:MAG: Stk1 family PASTA domain-containing Ser/Thr kinase [Dehalococcoidia bacterium]|nr:Stk1 family PASTA domain-containing Ser/Thr kinase [Dehalococcoidia bacterium]
MEQLTNRYRLIELVGQGGMAKVYRAEDQLLGRFVAVKVLREQYASDKAFLGRFLQEARSAGSLSHANIVNVFDVGDEAGRYFIVMEFVEGTSLKDMIQKEAPFPVGRVVSIASQICAGLQAAHVKNIVHRDVKPQNVLVTPEGQVKIADFGIARALGDASFSETGQIFGSIHYLSPEQAQGKPATPASDIYALGVVCYEMLTGRLPFSGETVVGVALRHIQEAPLSPHQLNPAIPPTLEAIVLKALAKDPAARYGSAKEMGQALREYTELGGQATGVINTVQSKAKPVVGADTAALAPAVADDSGQISRRSGCGGNFLLLVLTILAIISVLGLCALGATLVQTYRDKFTINIPTIIITPPVPTATAGLPVKVPRVEGMDAARARQTIESVGLTYREGPPEFNNSIQVGQVIRQSVQPETNAVRGFEVLVVLSKGQQPAEAPAVTGMKFTDASAKLVAMGFTVVRQDQLMRTNAPETVYDQLPKAGAELPRGSAITLIVSVASDKFTVPNVVGRSEEDAKKAITDAGLRNNPFTNYQGHGDLPERLLEMVQVGEVLSTKPPGGTEVTSGMEILMAVRKD